MRNGHRGPQERVSSYLTRQAAHRTAEKADGGFCFSEEGMMSPIFSDTAAGKINWALVEMVVETDSHFLICFARREVKLTKAEWKEVESEMGSGFRENLMNFVMGMPNR
jgi:hypothetical protein